MDAAAPHQPTLVEISHAERENAAYNAAMSASARKSPDAFSLWRKYAEIHSQRPAAVVLEMEKRMGLD